MGVLVTGGAGYIGSHMVWTLLDAGEHVVVIDRLSTGFEWAVPREANLVTGDIADRDLVRRIIRDHEIDAVIHFAGSVVVPDSLSDPLGYYENNTSRSRSLIETVVRAQVPHFIFSSTAAVYGTASMTPVAETAALMPASPYGRSKLMTEIMLADIAAAHDMRYTALRYFNVAGADPRLRTGQSTRAATHLVKAACEAATGKRAGLQIFGTDYPTPDGTCVRDYIHVSDLADAHYRALLRLRAGGSNLVANCGYGSGYSVLEVIAAVRRVAGRDFTVQRAPRRAGDPPFVVADSTLARRELGWIPRHDDLDVIIRTALAWENALTMRNTAPGLEMPEPGPMIPAGIETPEPGPLTRLPARRRVSAPSGG
jgi:UDP-glucose 4-epimerase